MEILFLTTVLPDRRSSGGEAASQTLIEALRAAGHRVTVLGYRRAGDDSARDPNSYVVGERSIETVSASFFERARWLSVAGVRRVPYSVAKYRSAAYRASLRERLSAGCPELAIVEHAQMGWLAPQLLAAGVPMVACAQNVEHRLYGQRAQESRTPTRWLYEREARLVKQLEDRLAGSAAAVWTLTEDDRLYYAGLGADARALALPSDFEPPEQYLSEKRCDVGLIGTWTWSLARKALEWFTESVVPLLPPALDIQVAGRGAQWLDAGVPRIRYRGFVGDARDFMSTARVVAIPSVGNTGIQVKMLDAIASGSQIVASPDAVRGISDVPASVAVANSAEDFAAWVVQRSQSEESLTQSRVAFEWSRLRRERFAADVEQAVQAAVG